MNMVRIIGRNIKRLREAQGITQEELSFRAKMSVSHLGSIERGMSNPTVETINRIAHVLNVEASIFLMENEAQQLSQEESMLVKKYVSYLMRMPKEKQKRLLDIIDALFMLEMENEE